MIGRMEYELISLPDNETMDVWVPLLVIKYNLPFDSSRVLYMVDCICPYGGLLLKYNHRQRQQRSTMKPKNPSRISHSQALALLQEENK